jgi:acetoin utilization deacetylase AcuC-like enzyme
MERVLIVHDAGDDTHRAPHVHPERPERTRAVLGALRSSASHAALDFERAVAAPRAALTRVHTAGHVTRVERLCAAGGGWLDDDTYATAQSFDVAARAVGAAVRAARAAADGVCTAAFAVCRPPGHHAESDRAMGFCLFDQVAVAADDLVHSGRAARVFVLDFDVHHGNGTQEIFWERGDVFYASLHQSPCYPGTGHAHERGAGDGVGATLNLPLPPGSGSDAWLAALDEAVLPAIERFAPDVLLFSAGFDAHRADPLAECRLESATYHELTRRVLDAARPSTRGRVASVLEGGYDLAALGESALAHVEALLAGGARVP